MENIKKFNAEEAVIDAITESPDITETLLKNASEPVETFAEPAKHHEATFEDKEREEMGGKALGRLFNFSYRTASKGTKSLESDELETVKETGKGVLATCRVAGAPSWLYWGVWGLFITSAMIPVGFKVFSEIRQALREPVEEEGTEQ